MAVYTEIDIDFVRQKYQKVIAKAGDEASRFLHITCYNDGVLEQLDAEENEVYLRYKKADGTNVFKKGSINESGQVDVEITKQMMAAYGICYADLLILDKDGIVEEEAGQIQILAAYILSSMIFVVNVQAMAFSDDALESMDDYDDLTEIIELAKLNAEKIEGYLEEARHNAEVSQEGATNALASQWQSEAWAVGQRDGVDVPSTDEAYHNNSKYYSEVADDESQEAEAWAKGTRDGVADPERTTDNSKYYSEQSAHFSEVADAESQEAESWARGTKNGAVVPERATDNSKYYSEQSSSFATASDNSRKRSEAWAVGEIDGVAVPDTDEAYENNAKFWADYAEDMYEQTVFYEDHAEAWANGTINGQAIGPSDPAYHKNSKYWAALAQSEVEPRIHGADMNYTLKASRWFSGAYSFEDENDEDNYYPYEDYHMWIEPSEDATYEQIKAFGNAILTSYDNQNILIANGDIPTIDIPVILYLIAKITP